MSRNDADAGSEPHPIDRHVGARIRIRRREAGLTQSQLAEAVGVTFQQVQKYERAANRISASKLWEIAQVLGVSVAYFYEGLGEPAHAERASPDVVHALVLTPEGAALAAAFPQIRERRVRRKIVELARLLVAEPVNEA